MGGASVGTIGFAYGRDPVPHSPPRFFGYYTTQKQLFHTLFRYHLAQSGIGFGAFPDSLVKAYEIDNDLGDTLYYDRIYVSTPTDSAETRTLPQQLLHTKCQTT